VIPDLLPDHVPPGSLSECRQLPEKRWNPERLTRRDALALAALAWAGAGAMSNQTPKENRSESRALGDNGPGARTTRFAQPGARRRTIAFSGQDWIVKSSGGPVGPGPNRFSGGENNVFVDQQGRLHLRITHDESRWRCAEVVSVRSFGLGTYRFTIDSGIDDLDPNVVLGLFTWNDAPEYHHRELDVEISRWGDPTNQNAQFVVQPYTRKANIVRFSIAPGRGPTTHSITWRPDRVICQSWAGAGPTRPNDSNRLHQHTFTQDIPKPGGENARINLWLIDGKPPSNRKDVEIICSRFAFEPPEVRSP
jgi:hypothetical protein